MFKIRYTDKKTNNLVELEIDPAMDVICVSLLENKDIHHGVVTDPLDIHINTDAILIDSNGERVTAVFFNELDVIRSL